MKEQMIADIHGLADLKHIPWDDDPAFLAFTKKITGKEHLDDLEPEELQKFANALAARPSLAKALHYRSEFQGLDISIENRKGSIRSGVSKDGTPWSVKMTHPYGYIRMTQGVDGDHVDCFIGPNPDSTDAYIIHAMEAPEFTDYDEDKVMLGFDLARDAKQAFLENYSDPRFFGTMHVMPMEEFKKKVLATKDVPVMIKAQSAADNKAYMAETALIRENAKKPENQHPHPFKAADWTWPNAHPRCLRCGEEEPVSGMCSGHSIEKSYTGTMIFRRSNHGKARAEGNIALRASGPVDQTGKDAAESARRTN